MKFIITYTSYHTYKDYEVYDDKATAQQRYKQLETCKNVTELKMREK
jgi:hypothetical protein